MGSPFQSFRELIPFTHTFAGQPLSDRIRSRISEIARQDAEKIAPLLTNEIIPAVARQGNLHMRFKLLEDVRREAERILPALEQALKNAVLPLPKSTLGSTLHADNLIKALAAAYHEIVSTIVKRNESAALAHILHRSTLQAMLLLVRRQKFAYLACTKPSASSWLMLHQLYQNTSSLHGTPAHDDLAAIKQQYLGALLLAYLEPNKLPRSELDTLMNCVSQLAPHAQIFATDSQVISNKGGESTFFVQPEKGSPGHSQMRIPHGSQHLPGLNIDCSGVVKAINRNIASKPGKPATPLLDAPPALLQTLLLTLTGKGTRQFNRSRFRPRTDLVVGLDAVISFIEETACTRRSVDAIIRDDRPVISSEWSMIDESANGFLIRFLKGNKWQASAGDVVAIQPRESSKVHVCLVRRVSSTRGHLELGLQLLSPKVSIIELATENLGNRRAIFLHNLPAHGKCPGIIAKPGQLKTRQQIVFKTADHFLQRQIGKCIEANEGLEFVALTPLPD